MVGFVSSLGRHQEPAAVIWGRGHHDRMGGKSWWENGKALSCVSSGQGLLQSKVLWFVKQNHLEKDADKV